MSTDDPNRYNHESVASRNKSPRDYSDSPLSTKEKLERMEKDAQAAKDESNNHQTTLQEAARHANDGIYTLQTVLQLLPPSQARNNAEIFMSTASLWMQQAFNEAEAKLQMQIRAQQLKEQQTGRE